MILEKTWLLLKSTIITIFTNSKAEYQKAVTTLTETETIIICDFSENYEGKLQKEIQTMHFGASKSQISLYTVMIYLKNKSQ